MKMNYFFLLLSPENRFRNLGYLSCRHHHVYKCQLVTPKTWRNEGAVLLAAAALKEIIEALITIAKVWSCNYCSAMLVFSFFVAIMEHTTRRQDIRHYEK